MLLAHAGPAAAVPPPLPAALLAAALLAVATLGGGLAGRTPRARRPGVRLLAGGVLLALAALGPAPAALRAAGAGTAPVLGLVLLGAGTALGVGRLAGRSCCRAGQAGLAGLVLHRLVEGAALGAGLLAGGRAGLALAVGLAVHAAGEGFALAGYLRALTGSTAALRWLIVLAAAPLTGVLLFRLAPVPAVLVPASLAVLTGVLLAMALVLLRAAHAGAVLRPGLSAA